MRGNNHECDVLVAGSGAAGLTAAITAAHHGLEVVVAESEPLLGGTTARTAGGLWLPCNRVAAARGIEDSPEKARSYLRAMAGKYFDEQRVNAFLENAPRALAFLLDHTAVRFFCPVSGSDYHSELPGSLEVGRTLYSEPFDGRLLGKHLLKLASLPPVHTFMGMMPQAVVDLPHFLRANRSPRSAWYVGGRLVRHGYDRLIYGRGTRLTNGMGLVGRLVKSAVDKGIPLWTSSSVTSLLGRERGVGGAIVDTPSGKVAVHVRRGVVLACGGFSHDESLRESYFARALNAHRYWPATAPGAMGNGLHLGLSVGAAVNDRMAQPAGWTPVSLVPTSEGNVEVLPAIWGRAMPGVIAVGRDGRRFANEAAPYHDFSIALIAATQGAEEVCAFLVCDAAALRRYGLGHVRPFPIPHGRHLRSGYLLRGQTLAELARTAGIDAGGLVATVEAFNRDARLGKDSAFGKGTTSYNRRMGDESHKPNPCVAPLEQPPFYAVKLVVGDRGTYVGLSTDTQSRVLDDRGRPIAGLYAAGNDMASIFGGTDAGGSMLAQAITSGFVAGCHLGGLPKALV